MSRRILLPWLALTAFLPGLALAAPEPPLPPLPELPAELKAEVEALKKPIHKYTSHCYTRPVDRSDSELPGDCEKLGAKLRTTLKAARPEVMLHAIFRHGVLYLVRAGKLDTYEEDRVWQGGDDANAALLAEFAASGDAHTVAQYAIYAMRLAQQDDRSEVEYSSANARVLWLAWLTSRATQAPYPAVKGAWDPARLPAGKFARHWREWWATHQGHSAEELRKHGLAQTLAALADADPGVRYWAVLAALDTKLEAARLPTLWAVREALMDASLPKAAVEAFDQLSLRFNRTELLQPPPLAGKVGQLPHLPPPVVQDPIDPLDQAVAKVALPPVPAEHKETVARLVPLYRKMATVCWGRDDGEFDVEWSDACEKTIEEIRGEEEPPLEARWHAAARGLFAPAAEGKLKLPKKTKPYSPVQAADRTLGENEAVAGLIDQLIAHAASLALTRPSWSDAEDMIIQELQSKYSSGAMRAAGESLPWEPVAQDGLRANLRRQLAAWNLRSALAKDHKGRPWARLSLQLARSGNLGARYRFVCQPYWVDTKAERAEAARLVRQVLLDADVAPKTRAAFDGMSCPGLKPREVLVGSPWPLAIAAQGFAAVQETPEAAAPLSCHAALQGWHAQGAVQACGAAVGDDGEPKAEALWAQLDAGQDPTRIQALVEPWLPRLQGGALHSLREVWAAAATATGQRQAVAERLTAWLDGSRDSALADRLALLQGRPASPRWWLTAATGSQCTARHGHPADAAWLARRGWIGGLPAFAKAVAGMAPSLRAQVDLRVASACPVRRLAAD